MGCFPARMASSKGFIFSVLYTKKYLPGLMRTFRLLLHAYYIHSTSRGKRPTNLKRKRNQRLDRSASLSLSLSLAQVTWLSRVLWLLICWDGKFGSYSETPVQYQQFLSMISRVRTTVFPEPSDTSVSG